MIIRPVRFRDLPILKEIFSGAFSEEFNRRGMELSGQFGRWQQMYPLVRALSLFPNPYQYLMNLHLAEIDGEIAGFIHTSPGNQHQSRWHIDYLAVAPTFRGRGVAKHLLDFTFEAHQDAKSFTIEIDVRNLPAIGLVTEKGFRRYATLHYFQLLPELLDTFEPCEPPEGLRPYRPRDAAGILALYNACTPSSMRLIDSRTISDFEHGIVERTISKWRRKLGLFEELRYVVCDQQKRVISYLRIIGQLRSAPHSLQLMVHPGYEDLAEPLIRWALGKLRSYPKQVTLAWTPDYQPAKMSALENTGFTQITADHLFVRDTVVTIRMPIRSAQAVDDASFKPVFFDPTALSYPQALRILSSADD